VVTGSRNIVGQYLNLTQALEQSRARANPVTDYVMGAVLHILPIEVDDVCFDAFTVTKFYEALSGKQPCKCNKMHQRFEDKLRSHL
jgi:hypothetical protein